MVFKPTKPAAPDDLDVSQGDIQGNFQTSNTVMAVNHFEFDITTGQEGMHRKVDLPVLAAPPTTGANVGVFYNTTSAPGASTDPLAVFRKQNSAGAYANATKDIPFLSLTPISMGVFDGTGAALVGSAYNNGGCVRNSVGVFTVSGLPAATANYVLLVTPQFSASGVTDNLCTVRINTKTATAFQVVFTIRAGGSNTLTDPTSFSYVMFGGNF